MSNPKSNLSHALSPRYAESAKKASSFLVSPVPQSGNPSSSSKSMILSQSAPVPSGFLHGAFPAPPTVKPLEAPKAAPPALALPTSLPDSETSLDVWQVSDKLGRSFYSSSMPANISVRGMFGGRVERDAAAEAAGGRRRASSTASNLSSSVNATIFGFMSGGSATDPSMMEAAARSANLGSSAGLAQSLSTSPGSRFGRFRESIAEESSAVFDSDDDELAVRPKVQVKPKRAPARIDSGGDDLQFSLALDEDA
jgi:hypothetical protein